MTRRAFRVLLFLLLLGTAALAGYQGWRLETARLRQLASANAFDALSLRLAQSVVDLRAAERAYVSSGQGFAWWKPRVDALLQQIRQDLTTLKSAPSAPPGTDAAVDAALEALSESGRLERRIADAAEAGRIQFAADIVYADGLQASLALERAVDGAILASKADLAEYQREARIQELILAAVSACIGLFLALMWFPSQKRPVVAAAETATHTTSTLGLDLPLMLGSSSGGLGSAATTSPNAAASPDAAIIKKEPSPAGAGWTRRDPASAGAGAGSTGRDPATAAAASAGTSGTRRDPAAAAAAGAGAGEAKRDPAGAAATGAGAGGTRRDPAVAAATGAGAGGTGRDPATAAATGAGAGGARRDSAAAAAGAGAGEAKRDPAGAGGAWRDPAAAAAANAGAGGAGRDSAAAANVRAGARRDQAAGAAATNMPSRGDHRDRAGASGPPFNAADEDGGFISGSGARAGGSYNDRQAAALVAAADLCTSFARVTDPADLSLLVAQMSQQLDAAGVIVWLVDAQGLSLRPALSHGYPAEALSRLGRLELTSDNATARAFRLNRPQTVVGKDSSPGALVVPITSGAGCVGAVAAELRQGREQDAGTLALARIFAAQLALLTGPTASDQAAPAGSAASQS